MRDYYAVFPKDSPPFDVFMKFAHTNTSASVLRLAGDGKYPISAFLITCNEEDVVVLKLRFESIYIMPMNGK